MPCGFEGCPNRAITEHRCSAKSKLFCKKEYGCGKLFCIEHESPRRTYTCFEHVEDKEETYVCYVCHTNVLMGSGCAILVPFMALILFLIVLMIAV